MTNNRQIHTDQNVSQSIGLDIALILSKLITGKSNLHYGIWDGLENTMGNLCLAQEAYTRKLFQYLPKKKNMKILDIGGGGGETANELLQKGHEVDIIVPSKELAKEAKKVTKGNATIYETTFENFKPKNSKSYDVCLFSESFQYIPMDISLPKSSLLLNETGIILVSDCFRSEAFKKSKSRQPGGGHSIVKMEEKLSELSLNVMLKEDITKSVAPSIDLEQKMFNALGEIISRLSISLKNKRVILYNLIRLLYKTLIKKKRREDIERRLFSKNRTSHSFLTYNRYLIFKLKP